MAKDLNINVLLYFYGGLLTERKREFLEYYYNDDMSLGEIAEISGISRQGVRDAIKRAEETLTDAEQKLGFAKKDAALRSRLAEISDCAEQIRNENYRGSLSRIINDLTVQIQSICGDLADSDQI